MKKGTFKWTAAAGKTFANLKKSVTEKLVLAILNFDKVFRVDCHASETIITVVLSQKGKPITNL